jgi:exopolysaccharide production protein ExoQ
MSPSTATLVFTVGIAGLFMLDRDRNVRTSIALWLPVAWLCIGGSRMVSEWLQPPLAPGALPGLTPSQTLDGSPLDRNVLMLLIAIGVMVLIGRRAKVHALLWANVPILLFFIYCAVSTSWSDYPLVAFKRWIKAFGDLVMVLIILSDPDPATAVKRVLARMGCLLMPLSILLIKYYPELGRGYENLTWVPVVTGVTTGKNLLGMICLLCGLSAEWRLLHVSRDVEGVRRYVIVHLTILLMALWLFWQANSMTALSCFLMASCVMLAVRVPTARRTALVHVVVASVLLLAFSAIFLDAGGNMLQTLGRDPTLTGRTQLWGVALEYSGDPLLGTGFESFWLGERLQRIWSIYWWHPNEAHNGYLEVFLNLGVVGVLLLGIVLVAGYRNVIRLLRHDPEAGAFRISYFVAAVAYNLTEAAIRTFQPIWVIFLLTIFAIPKTEPDAVVVPASASGEPQAAPSY